MTDGRRRAAAWAALVLLSAGLHLAVLGERSYHHDEAVHARLSWDLAEHGAYRYDPTYHGPLLYYLTAATYLVAGDSDLTARLPIAFAGILLLLPAYGLRRVLGDGAAWWTGLLVTLSPLFLFYGRFLRMDVLEALTASAALLALHDGLRGRPRAWPLLGVWAGLAFATKENAYVTSFLAVVAAGVVALWEGPRQAVPAAWAWLRERWTGPAAAAATFVLVTVPLYTVGFARPEDWAFPLRAIAYWWNQHTIQRVGGPWWFHLPRLGIYELLPIVAATVWVVRRRRRLGRVEVFLYALAVASVAMYCYLGEKVPWLGVHQVWLFLPLAGAQLARTFGPRGRWPGRSLAIAGLVYTAVVAVVANFVLEEISPLERRVEALHFVQTCPEMQAVVAEGLEAVEAGAPEVAAVSGEGVWPLSWYWRHLPVRWAPPLPGTAPPLVVCDVHAEAEVRTQLAAPYERRRLPLRAWWLMESERPTVAEVLRYLATRVPWGGIGSTDVVVLRRRAPAEGFGAQAVEAPGALARELGLGRARRLGGGWLVEPRGVALEDGRVAVVDVGTSRVSVAGADGALELLPLPFGLAQPEGVAWRGGELIVADTWNHRVLRLVPGEEGVETLPPPPGGWYGPRAVAVAADGRVAVADTGHKRVVLYDAGLAPPAVIGGAGDAPGRLEEPVGLAWLGHDALLVCDTGNRRLQVLGTDGAPLEVVRLPDAWPHVLSRPQAAALGRDRWLVTDPPQGVLWLVEAGTVRRLDLAADGVWPAGVAWDGEAGVLALSDTAGSVWLLEDGGA